MKPLILPIPYDPPRPFCPTPVTYLDQLRKNEEIAKVLADHYAGIPAPELHVRR